MAFELIMFFFPEMFFGMMVKAFLLNVAMALEQDEPSVTLGKTPPKSTKDWFSFFHVFHYCLQLAIFGMSKNIIFEITLLDLIYASFATGVFPNIFCRDAGESNLGCESD